MAGVKDKELGKIRPEQAEFKILVEKYSFHHHIMLRDNLDKLDKFLKERWC